MGGETTQGLGVRTLLVGSCLSPLLFITFINDMPTNPGTQLNMFADNTMIHATIINIQHATNQHGRRLPWLGKWKLTLNANKKVAIKFGKNIKEINPIKIKGNVIPWTTGDI